MGTRVIITGGILRDGSLLSDIIVVDLAHLRVLRCARTRQDPCASTLCPVLSLDALFHALSCAQQGFWGMIFVGDTCVHAPALRSPTLR